MTAREDVVDRIRALEDRRYQAMTDGDVVALEELFAADLVYTHSDAKTDTRQSYLDKLANGYFKYGPISHPESTSWCTATASSSSATCAARCKSTGRCGC